jgi:hypothetical protein
MADATAAIVESDKIRDFEDEALERKVIAAAAAQKQKDEAIVEPAQQARAHAYREAAVALERTGLVVVEAIDDTAAVIAMVLDKNDDYAVKIEPGFADNLVFYDTFDWRLHRQSLILLEAGHRLLLRRLDDLEIIQQVEVEAQPVFVWDLPEGELKAQLTPIVEMRALLKLADIQTSSTAYCVLNQAKKTVVWLGWEKLRLSSTPDGPALTTYIGVKPVRGYPKHEARLVSRFEDLGLASVGLASVGAEDCYFKVLEAAGKKPGDYSAKLRLKLSPEMRADEATTVILRFLLDVIKTNEAYVKQDIDTEFLHDFRVAVRRTRSSLSQIKAVFPEDVTERFKRDFATIGQLSNELRDLDVYLLDAPRYRALLPEFLRDDIEPLFELLRHRRAQALQEFTVGLNLPGHYQVWQTYPREFRRRNAACLKNRM